MLDLAAMMRGPRGDIFRDGRLVGRLIHVYNARATQRRIITRTGHGVLAVALGKQRLLLPRCGCGSLRHEPAGFVFAHTVRS